jgi:2-polyprenyl-6-methoxyphenol hydroxylase-like FAD-dependent oxidoreductase
VNRDHAVVIGGSFAGCAAARVLSDHFDRVTVVERDEFPEEWAPRKGVPQSPHVHGILKLGRETLDQLLPGFIKDTESLGAVLFDQVSSGAAFTPYGWCARGRSNVLGYGVRRALLEHVVRQRVTALEKIDLVQGRAQGLVVNRPGGWVQGLKLADSEGVSQIEADLVVDAGGRASPAPRWLEESGHTPPEESVVNGLVGYASRWIRVPDDAWPSPGDMRFVAQLPMLGCTKGAIVYPQDNGLHVVSLFGQSRDYPPGNENAFMAFLEQCATPMMHYVVSRSEAVSGISTSRSTANRWRHYELLAEPARGFVALGDAMASFNPIFGKV